MTKIKIIAIGSLSPKFKSIFDDYAKKIKFFCDFSITEIKEISEEKNIDIKIKKETALILNHIDSSQQVILTSLRGNLYNSFEFANLLNKLQNRNIAIIIGGSNGVDESKFKNSIKISFSNLTFPHQLFRVMLAEQIYRGYSILNNNKYHK
ncbi:23S rRNA (pseudouridine(1915)-N(3))-methyltransferase RlmH [Mycoplasma tauri]|uniref:23S rRNA (pseudouridine(1915)-N(3))-methyltransferase RlmH n=1 Tax=Mycoplasma tauri TaxID=547987 RepID=UPI001CC0D72D|nr:23S rRNA (pseudouridine(1915)-N(3))-methyltransferase RlmH [Mycoplasma tauri]MBZ4218157.1 23S rRNA (pseudouridine(1915)-N(3))-methyltransferase RlmH [Mycoplasma tauri]